MRARRPFRIVAAAATSVLVVSLFTVTGGLAAPAFAASPTTAWQNGAFAEDTGGIVSRSDVFLGKPNTLDTQSVPLGNGSLGVAAWAANGFTAQLNRNDTMPYRLSPGQVQIPGLAAMTSASNFTGSLDLYNGVLDESGGGMTMQAWVPEGKDELIVNVTGAPAGTQESATLNLWSGRSPAAAASGAIGSLAQTWVDNSQTGNSGQTFGAMAAITAGGQNVTASVVNSEQVKVSFTPNADGSFRIVVASPGWTGGNAATTASSLIGGDTTTAASTLLATQSSWWNNHWATTGLIEMNSSDGTAQYLENLRILYLYTEAASMKTGSYPGSQAGVADMFAYDEDQQDWYPAGYWLWNLRGQIAANLSSGNFALNLPIFTMYLNDLPAIESWTSAQMGGKPGACVPETMRFNGNGYYNGGSASSGASCALASSPTYNAEDVTSGAELALWIWQQYQDTGSAGFLQTYYPIMEQAATFLLAYQNKGSDGFLHATANAHETQWAVTDPTTDLAADQALFPATVSAATLLNTDSSLVSQLKTAETEIEPYARTDQSTKQQLLNPQPTSASAAASADAAGNDVIADSYQPSATLRNSENIGLETVWPYGDITDNTTVNGDNLTALADRTYNNRPNGTTSADWNFDAVDAARLDMSSQVASDLVATTENYQIYIDGLNAFSPPSTDEPYIEQSSTVATAIDEALATDYDGTLRIAPAWPSGWDGSGTVYIQGGSKVDVQVESGTITTVAIQAGTTQTMSVRSPWSGQQVEVVNGSTGAAVVAPTTAGTLSVPVTAGTSYLVEQTASLTASLPFAQITGTRATAYKSLGGKVQIGIAGSGAAPGGPYGGSPAGVPGTVQAENYDTGGQGVAYNVSSVNGSADSYRSDGVDLETTSDTGGGDDVGWTGTGQWFKYTVDVATAGTYAVSLRVAAPSAVTDALHIANSSGTNLSGNVNVASTGGWQTWATVTANVTLPAGTQTLTLNEDNGGWNVNYLAFASTGGGGGGVNTSAWYEVVNQNSGLCASAAGGATANGTAVEQLACTGATSQRWQFVPAATGEYEVLNENAQSQGESWNITGGVGATAGGTLLQTWNYGGTGNTNALFAANAQSGGYYTFTADNSGLCIDTPSASTASGVQLEQYTCNGTTAQSFQLVQ